MRYLTCDPRAETLGVNILAYLENLRNEEIKPIAQKHGLGSVQPTDWVPTHQFLDALNDMGQTSDFMSALVAVGKGIGEIVPIPFEDPGLGDVLTVWNDIYQGLHRNADVGLIACEKETDTHYKLIFTDLYPDDFSYGIMYGYAKRFLPTGTQFTIYYDPKVTPRDRGGSLGYTVIHAKWD